VKRSDLRDELSIVDNLLTLGTQLNLPQLLRMSSRIFCSFRHDDSPMYATGNWRIEPLKPMIEMILGDIEPGSALSER